MRNSYLSVRKPVSECKKPCIESLNVSCRNLERTVWKTLKADDVIRHTGNGKSGRRIIRVRTERKMVKLSV